MAQRHNVHLTGEGTQTIVLAHGFGSSQTAWEQIVPMLEPHYRLVLFDYLGCGKTDVSDFNPLRYTSMQCFADDVLRLYEELDLRNTIFIGHSASAMIGALACLTQPERFESLIFVSASPRYLNDGDYHGGFEQADLDALYAAMAENYLNWAHGFAPIMMANAHRPELGRRFAQSLAEMQPDIAQSVMRVIFEADCRAEIHGIPCPVLILQPTHDPAVPTQVGAYLNAHIPQNQLVMLNTHGHLPHISAPHEVTTALQAYLGFGNTAV
jgi:sigma-B regulation protein RsbQ